MSNADADADADADANADPAPDYAAIIDAHGPLWQLPAGCPSNSSNRVHADRECQYIKIGRTEPRPIEHAGAVPLRPQLCEVCDPRDRDPDREREADR